MALHVIRCYLHAACSLGLTIACVPSARTPAGVCLIDAERAAVRDVEVRVGDERLSLQLHAAQVSVTLGAERVDAVLQVHRPLRFETLHPVGDLDLRVQSPVTLHEGRVVVGAGFKPTEFRVHRDHLQTSLERSLHVGMAPAPQLPCSALTLARRDARYVSPKRRRPAGTRWVSVGPGSMPLHRSRLSDHAITIDYRGPFQLLELRQGWARVRADWEDGSRVQGWVPAKGIHDRFEWLGGWGEGFETPGGCAAADLPFRRHAEVAAGAAVAASPDGAVWAHFSERQWVTVFAPRPADKWLAVASIPGIALNTCAESLYTWIRARDVIRFRRT